MTRKMVFSVVKSDNRAQLFRVFFFPLNNGTECAYFAEARPAATVTFSVEQKEKFIPFSSVHLLIQRLPHSALGQVKCRVQNAK